TSSARLARVLDALYHQAKPSVATITGMTTTSMIAVELIISSCSAEAIGPFGSNKPWSQPASIATAIKARTGGMRRMPQQPLRRTELDTPFWARAVTMLGPLPLGMA